MIICGKVKYPIEIFAIINFYLKYDLFSVKIVFFSHTMSIR